MIDWPLALHETALTLLRSAVLDNLQPTQFEIRFGKGAMENLGRDVLRSITRVQTINDVPVVFPEEPFLIQNALDLGLRCDRGGRRCAISADLVKGSAGVVWGVAG